jgi:flagellar biosynthesis chaperone FliJ
VSPARRRGQIPGMSSPEPEQDHEQLADQLDKRADEMAERSDELEEQIDNARRDWESKREDGDVGAPPPGNDG